MRKNIICFFIFLLSLSLYSETFRFSQEEDMEYRIIAEVEEGVWLDRELLGQSSILNRISVKVLEEDSQGAYLDVSYGISEKSLDTGLYIYNSEANTRFYRSSDGRYGQIPQDEYLPSVRNIPSFPEKDLMPGDSWMADAVEVHDLKPFFSVDYRLHIPFRVFYTYKGVGEYEGRPVDIIHINYHFYQNIDLSSLSPELRPDASVDLPVAVSGDFNQVYLWDPSAGIPAAVEDEFKIAYTMTSGVNYIFKGQSEGRVVEADHWNKEDVLDQIEEAVEDMKDVSASMSDEGLVLTLDNIHFVADQAVFLPGEETKLLELKELLLRFPEHDLLITGHTARIGNSLDQGQQLSEDRAAAVAGFFLKHGVRDSSRMIVQGKGAKDPIGDNSHEAGRQKNRRVEITILDN